MSCSCGSAHGARLSLQQMQQQQQQSTGPASPQARGGSATATPTMPAGVPPPAPTAADSFGGARFAKNTPQAQQTAGRASTSLSTPAGQGVSTRAAVTVASGTGLQSPQAANDTAGRGTQVAQEGARNSANASRVAAQAQTAPSQGPQNAQTAGLVAGQQPVAVADQAGVIAQNVGQTTGPQAPAQNASMMAQTAPAVVDTPALAQAVVMPNGAEAGIKAGLLGGAVPTTLVGHMGMAFSQGGPRSSAFAGRAQTAQMGHMKHAQGQRSAGMGMVGSTLQSLGAKGLQSSSAAQSSIVQLAHLPEEQLRRLLPGLKKRKKQGVTDSTSVDTDWDELSIEERIEVLRAQFGESSPELDRALAQLESEAFFSPFTAELARRKQRSSARYLA